MTPSAQMLLSMIETAIEGLDTIVDMELSHDLTQVLLKHMTDTDEYGFPVLERVTGNVVDLREYF